LNENVLGIVVGVREYLINIDMKELISQVVATLQIGVAKATGGFSSYVEAGGENLLSRSETYAPGGSLDQNKILNAVPVESESSIAAWRKHQPYVENTNKTDLLNSLQ